VCVCVCVCVRVFFSIVFSFGPGPYRIEVLLEFPPSHGKAPRRETLLLELSALDNVEEKEMPPPPHHAIYTFLRQVDLGLWDGCSIHRNTPDFLQVGPLPNHLSTSQNRMDLFEQTGYRQVLIEEPPPPPPPPRQGLYDIAFYKGGPDILISTSAAPPTKSCWFGRVVQGQDIVEQIHKESSVHPEDDALIRNIAIVHMQIVEQEEEEEDFADEAMETNEEKS